MLGTRCYRLVNVALTALAFTFSAANRANALVQGVQRDQSTTASAAFTPESIDSREDAGFGTLTTAASVDSMFDNSSASGSLTASFDIDPTTNAIRGFSGGGGMVLNNEFVIIDVANWLEFSFDVIDAATVLDFNLSLNESDERIEGNTYLRIVRSSTGESSVSVLPTNSEDLIFDLAAGESYTLTLSATSSVEAELDSFNTSFNFSATFSDPPDESRMQSWINLGSGDFGNPGNWLPEGVPTSNDRIDFFQSGSYTVELDESRTVHSLQAAAGDVTIDLAGHSLSFSDDSSFLTDGWLEVQGSGGLLATLTLRSGEVGATLGMGRIDIARRGRGKLVIDNAQVEANTLLSATGTGRGELEVTGPNARLEGNLFNTGLGSSEVTVQDGGHLLVGHMTIGSDAASNDQLTIAGAGSELKVSAAGSIGDGVLLAAIRGNASIAVLDGGTIDTFHARIGGVDTTIPVPFPTPGLGPFEPLSTASANLLISGAGSRFKVHRIMEVGQIGRATLLVDQGGVVEAETFRLGGGTPEQGQTFTSIATITDPGSRLETASVNVGGETHLIVENGGAVDTSLFWLFGQSTIRGANTQVTAVSNQTAVRLFGGSSVLIIEEGATLTSNSVRHVIGSGSEASSEGQPGALVHVRGAGSLWDMGNATDLQIAINPLGVDGGNGELRLEDLARVVARSILVGSGGRVTGSNSIIEADVQLLGGTIAPGLSPGELTIDGNLFVDASSDLVVEIGGLSPGIQHDVLAVTGDVDIEGAVVLQFIDGFAPREGDVFDFLTVTGVADFSGASLVVEGLAPGFQFSLDPSGGALRLTALTDGEFVPEPDSAMLFLVGAVLALRRHSRRFMAARS